jgi:mannose-6-phosphate isomerase
VTLRELVEALPEEMVGRRFAEHWGPITGVLVKLLSPAGQVPLHAHPTREWARQHLDSPFGKTEAWILLDTPGDGQEPAYAGIGFVPGTSRAWFAGAARRHDTAGIRATLHRTPVYPGEVYVAHAGVPHYLGPRISFIEGPGAERPHRDPRDVGSRRRRGTMGLGWDLALDMIDYTTAGRADTLARARQQPRVLRTSHESREVRLFSGDVLPFFDATALEVPSEIEVSDGRFSIAVVAAGDGWVEGDFGRLPIRRGQTFALPASLPVRIGAGRESVRVIRCLGPAVP